MTLDSGLYAFPSFGCGDSIGVRVGGGGLGNLLFPFARCAIASRRFGLRRINPTWPAIHIGPILRGERDKRLYADLFEDTFGIGGVRKLWLLNRGILIAENEFTPTSTGPDGCARVVVFQGLGGLFHDIRQEHAFVRSEILALARPRQKAHMDAMNEPVIGMHIRMGDFGPPPAPGAQIKSFSNVRTPIRWYVSTVQKIRRFAGTEVPIHLFSDGTDGELAEILRQPNLRRVSYGSALADLLALSKCKMLIGSGGSTFSMWASYLGRMPAIWHPGLLTQRLYSSDEAFEGELAEPANLPDALQSSLSGFA